MSKLWSNLKEKRTTGSQKSGTWTIAEKSIKTRNKRGDAGILVVTLGLSLVGLLFVYSASAYSAERQYGDSFYFLKKQAIGFIVGTIFMFLAGKFDYQKLRDKKVRWFSLVIPMILLALVFVPGIGKSNYGATRWIGIGALTIQPSELAKYGFVIFASAYAADNMSKMRTIKGALPVLLSGGLICLLIILEPNMSVTMCVGCLMLAMLFLSGMKWRYFFAIGIPVLVAVPLLIIMEPYRLLRLSAFLDPWASPKEEGYQLIQSLYALGGGGWFGTGLFRSRQKYLFLPFAESDFILAIIGEETGFIGICFLFLASAFLVWRGIKTASRADDFFSFLLASGITLVYAIQTLINALVVSGAIPPTGIPLPLISSGNTSLIVTMTSMGVLYGISRKGRCTKKKKAFIR